MRAALPASPAFYAAPRASVADWLRTTCRDTAIGRFGAVGRASPHDRRGRPLAALDVSVPIGATYSDHLPVEASQQSRDRWGSSGQSTGDGQFIEWPIWGRDAFDEIA